MITIFARSVRSSTLQNRSKQNNFQVTIVIANGGDVGLGEWIIDGTDILLNLCSRHREFLVSSKAQESPKLYM